MTKTLLKFAAILATSLAASSSFATTYNYYPGAQCKVVDAGYNQRLAYVNNGQIANTTGSNMMVNCPLHNTHGSTAATMTYVMFSNYNGASCSICNSMGSCYNVYADVSRSVPSYSYFAYSIRAAFTGALEMHCWVPNGYTVFQYWTES